MLAHARHADGLLCWAHMHACRCTIVRACMHVCVFVPSQAAQRQLEREEEELRGLTLTPHISRMARELKRDGSEASFERLTKRGTHTLQVRVRGLGGGVVRGGGGCGHLRTCSG